MATQPAQKITFHPGPPSHLHLNAETCPTCGQEIPPDRIEEIKGKVAAQEVEQRLAITSQLKQQFAVERTRIESEAQERLERERQESASRLTNAQRVAQQEAQELIQEKLKEAELARQELIAGWQQQIAEAAAEREAAEEAGLALHAEMEAIQRKAEAEVEAVRAAALRRETEIQDEARKNAELEAASQIGMIEEAKRESEALLQAQIEEANAGRTAAEQKEAAISLQLDEQQRSRDLDIERATKELSEAAQREKNQAIEATELRLRDTIAAQERAVAEANSKTAEAERRAGEWEESLKVQREALEKAKDDAVNAANARAFEENQKLVGKVNDLQRELEKKSANELGEGAEVDLYEALKTEFLDDKIERIPKGTPGADIRQTVIVCGQKCGTILYDSKNHKQFRWDHVSKLRTDQLAEKAEHAILATHKFPEHRSQIHVHEGVVMANPARVISIATILRQHLIQLHRLRMSEIEREAKTADLYEFITSSQCTDLISRIDQRAEDLLGLQKKEIQWHDNNWKKQGELVRTIQKTKAELETRISSIIGSGAEEEETSGDLEW